VRFLINLILFLVIAGALVYWLRSYFRPWVNTFRAFRGLSRTIRQAQRNVKDNVVRNFDSRGKVVDVSAKPTLKIGCPVCQEMLSEAQMNALRSKSIRCPASQQGSSCPYYGKALN
jgi:hypothetical protein